MRISAAAVPNPASPTGVFTARRARSLAHVLLDWFDRHARDLPWRQTRDPYAIWVSEVMLQQTQVATVVPYWERWMAQLPNLEALASAPEDRVLKLWEGLGYYSRARNLQRAARDVMALHGGHFPQRFQDIIALPGIGRYTAGAIASIAFNQPLPIVDGNVVRVLTRLAGMAANPREAATNVWLWATAGTLVQQASCSGTLEACSRFNQALMELGALVCTPRQPGCDICPWRGCCVARRTNAVNRLPNLGERKAVTPRRFVVAVMKHRGRWLVRRRPPGGVNAGLWEFPTVEVTLPKPGRDGGGVEESPAGLAGQMAGSDGATTLTHLGTVNCSITRFRLSLEVYCASLRRSTQHRVREGEWMNAAELGALTFSSAQRRILRMILGPDGK